MHFVVHGAERIDWSRVESVVVVDAGGTEHAIRGSLSGARSSATRLTVRTGSYSVTLDIGTGMEGLVLNVPRSWGWVDAVVDGSRFRFVNTHKRVRMLLYNQGNTAGGPFRLSRYPESRKAIKKALANAGTANQ